MKSMRFDLALLMSILALVGIGVVVIYSGSGPLAESRNLPSSFFVMSHLKKVVIGIVALIIGMKVDHQVWQRISRPLFLVSVILLVLVLVSSAALHVHGAKRWLSIGGFDFQPSEIVKISIFFLLASKLAELGEEIKNFQAGFVRPMVVVMVVFVLILLQPNYSTASSILAVSLVMLFAAGVRIRHMALIAVAGIPAIAFLAISSPYRMKRVLAFMDPEGHTGSSYQQLQSLISLGNGGLFGTGVGQSTQKLGYLPMPFTDTIYAILGEELGLMGTTLVLFLFGVLVWRGLTIARQSQSRFGMLLAVALTTAIALNAFIHIGVCTRILPATGQPLPLVSFGGTSLVMNLFAMGILLNLSHPDSGKAIRENLGGLA